MCRENRWELLSYDICEEKDYAVAKCKIIHLVIHLDMKIRLFKPGTCAHGTLEADFWMFEVYVWDDRAQHGMNAAFAFSLLLVLLLLAGLVLWTSNLCAAFATFFSPGVYLIDRCFLGRCLPQEIESSPDAVDDEEPRREILQEDIQESFHSPPKQLTQRSQGPFVS